MPNNAPPITLEVCVDSLTSAAIAAKAGAQRIELNAALELGGLTPSVGVVEQTILALRPMGCHIIAMVRPRPGGFAYNAGELAVMQVDIDRLLDMGVDGVALGVLDQKGKINEQANQSLIEPVLHAGKQVVFHRAFDLTPDPIGALDSLIQLGFTRVLTSGQAATAPQGIDMIRQLIVHAADRIQILPGCGINPENATQLIRATRCDQIHASLRGTRKDPTGSMNPAIRFNSTAADEGSYQQADSEKIAAMMRVLHAFQA
jgi:copper homeostasis protein